MSKLNSTIDSENTLTSGRSTQQSLWVRLGAWILHGYVAWIVLLLSLLVTFVIWKGAQETLLHAQQVQLENRTEEVSNAIVRRMSSYERVLRGGVGLFAASKSVERAAWRDYVASLEIKEQIPGIQGIGFSVHIPASRLDAHLRAIRAEGYPDYAIRPAGIRAEYTSIIYLEPLDWRNQRAIGFDMFSESIRRATMERARDTGNAVISAKVTLVQEAGKKVQPGMLMYLPHYKNGAPNNTLAERRANLVGYVYSPFRLNDLMSGILEKQQAGAELDIDIEIYDGTQYSADSLLYDDDGIAHALGKPDPEYLTLTRSIDLYGHTWSLYFITRPAFHAAFDQNKPLRFLVTGALLSVMLSVLIWMFATQRRRALALASHMTKDLQDFKVAQDSHSIISVADVRGNIIEVNSKFSEISGYSKQELLGKNHRMLKSGYHPQALYDELWSDITSGKVWHGQIKNRKKDGGFYWVDATITPILDEKGLPEKYISVRTDITQIKVLEYSLQQMNRELSESNEALVEKAEQLTLTSKYKSEFLSNMSHELRTPLNAILGYAQLMEMDTSLSQQVVENAGEIKRAGDYLLALINGILDLSRIESGKLELKMESVALADSMEQCYAHNIQAAKWRNITLRMDESCAAYDVHADNRGLLQVLNNMVSNAIKYNRAGGSVNVSCSEEVRGKVKISVMDTGMGIAAEKQSQLFQSFNRLGAEMSNIEGTGIGLVILRKLIEGMQGTIGFESVQGLGSTFWVELSIIKNVNAGLLELPTVTYQQGSAIRKVPHVLVAEDYVPNQNVLTLQLRTLGYTVDMAADGVAALNLWRKNTYDLILTDIDMPVMNGTEFVQAVRDEERVKGGRIPVLAITAASTVAEGKRYQSAGIDEVLSKPLSMDALRDGLTRWLGNVSVTPLNRDYPTLRSAPYRTRTPAGSTETAFVGAHPACDSRDFAILDLNYLYHILGQVNLVQARILLDTFMRTAAEGLDALNLDARGRKMDNAVAVAKEMHKQKSSARTVGALHYADLAATLEQQTKDAHFTGIAAALTKLREALAEVEAASTKLLESSRSHAAEPAPEAYLAKVMCHTALVVDDDLVVLQQVKAMLDALGVVEVVTAINGVEATRILANRGDAIELLVCDLSMPEMDGVELIRGFGKNGFKGGLILISGADEKIISTVNKLAVLQGLRVLGQLHKPVSAAQLAILLAHTADLPVQERQMLPGPVVSREAIRAAMDANEFSIWFQPKVDADSLKVVGMEALARWQLPSGKYVPPDNFITVAEREGLIGELSHLLVSLALSEAAKLFSSGFPLKIAINLSATWLNDLSLPDFVLAKTRLAGLRAEDVIFEVTETGVMEDVTTALDVLSRLRLKGFGLSIDDFGIGYSSFEQLGRIPFTEMKLDRSFVCKGVKDAAARAILESSMDMAHKLNLSTVAEGVETELELKLVRSLGCDLVQGYLIAKPMPVKDILVWLGNEKLKKRK